MDSDCLVGYRRAWQMSVSKHCVCCASTSRSCAVAKKRNEEAHAKLPRAANQNTDLLGGWLRIMPRPIIFELLLFPANHNASQLTFPFRPAIILFSSIFGSAGISSSLFRFFLVLTSLGLHRTAVNPPLWLVSRVRLVLKAWTYTVQRKGYIAHTAE